MPDKSDTTPIGQSELNQQASDLRTQAATFDEHAKTLRDAMNALTQAHADLKNDVENARDVNLTALTAAVDDVTAAVGAVTNHGGISASRSIDTKK
jgi:hypothetical protein